MVQSPLSRRARTRYPVAPATATQRTVCVPTLVAGPVGVAGTAGAGAVVTVRVALTVAEVPPSPVQYNLSVRVRVCADVVQRPLTARLLLFR